jgi:hypothetical protein
MFSSRKCSQTPWGMLQTCPIHPPPSPMGTWPNVPFFCPFCNLVEEVRFNCTRVSLMFC